MGSFAGFGGGLANALTTHFVRQGPSRITGAHPLSPETFNTHRIQTAMSSYKAYNKVKKAPIRRRGSKTQIKTSAPALQNPTIQRLQP